MAGTNTTTEEAIRDHMIALIAALTPRALAGDRFIPYQHERNARFRSWAEGVKQGSFRKFSVRDVGTGRPPDITNCDVQAVWVDFLILVAYPQTSRAGGDAALDRDDVKRADQYQIEQAVGLSGYPNFAGASPNASWVDGSSEWEEGDGVDFLAIRQTMRFYRSMT